MIKPKYHLQSLKDKNGNLVDSPILLLFSVNGKRLQYYSGVRVPEKYKPKKPGKYPFSNDMPGAYEAKIKLDSLVRHAFTIESELIKSGEPQTVEIFKERIDALYKGKVPVTKVSTIPSIEMCIADYLERAKNIKAYNTFRNNQTNMNHFREFLGKRARALTLADINDEMIEEFKDFLREGRLNNTVVKAIQVLRTFLQDALKKKHISTIPLMETGTPNNITVIHLSHQEVMNMAYTPMPSPSLERVRDFFVFGCFTGMRYSDIATLRKSNVFSDHIKVFIKKSGATQSLTIPLVEMSKLILEKYKNMPGEFAIKALSNQKTNDRLKEVAELAGLTSTVTIAHKDAFGKVTEVEQRKCELITCHTSRKSFITIAMTLGMPESVIMSITGHTKGSKAFTKYFDVVNQTKFEQMAKTFNFN